MTMTINTSTFKRIQKNPLPVLKALTTEEISSVIQQANDAYYNQSTPLLTDDVFDIVKDYLQSIDPENPILKNIGAPIPVYGTKVNLPFWMGSLEKIRDDPKALSKWITKYPGDCMVSDKLDGNSGMLVYYSDGGVALYSRGDGLIGQDLSSLIGQIRGVPSSSQILMSNLSLSNATRRRGLVMAIRGELIISKTNWEKIAHKGANARNVVAGAMHAKAADPEVTSKIDFVAYELLEPRLVPGPLKGIKTLEDVGFKTVHHEMLETAGMTMDTLSQRLMSRRQNSEYEIDGLVIMHNGEHRAIKGKNPAYGFAVKTLLTHDTAEVIVTEVTWNVSKDGLLKPLVNFAPVKLSGATIRKATGFNAQFIVQNHIGPGARICIIRSGDVIPYITKVLQPAMSPGLPDAKDTPWDWTATQVDIRIRSLEGSRDLEIKRMEHFLTCMGVEGVAGGMVARMHDHGINTIYKLVHATKEEILQINGVKDRSATKIYDALERVRSPMSCLDLMVASNVFGRGFAKKKMSLVLEAFPSITHPAGKHPKYEDLLSIEGIGQTLARQFIDRLPDYYRFIEDSGIQCPGQGSSPAIPPPKSQIQTKEKPALSITVIFTGFRNKELEDDIIRRGGRVTTSVSSNTTCLVAKNPSENSAKVAKAREKGIPVYTLEQFKDVYML